MDNDLGLFESLGDNCEFGLVQRHFGVEPLGLLRWSFSQPAALFKALGNDFSGVGEPGNSLLVAQHGDFRVVDKQSGLTFHTFIKPDTAEPDTVFREGCRRVAYLRRGLLADLTSGRKIFIYKYHYGELNPSFPRWLQAALSLKGPNTLVFVRQCRPGVPPGTVEDRGDGLLFGYVEHFFPKEDPANIDYASWHMICLKALAVWDDPARVLSRTAA